MSFSFVQGKGTSATAFASKNLEFPTAAVTYAGANTANNALLLFNNGIGAGYTPVSSVTDTLGNDWSTSNRIQYNPAVDANLNIEIWWVPKCKAGANTVTINWPVATYANWYVAEYAGGSAGDFQLDTSITSDTTLGSALVTSGNTPSASAGDLVLAYWAANDGMNPTSTSDGKTLRAGNTDSVAGSCALGELLISSSGAQSGGFNLNVTSTRNGGFIVAAFSAPASITNIRLYDYGILGTRT